MGMIMAAPMPARHARTEHHLGVRSKARHDVGDAENGETGDEHGFAAQAVTDRAQRQQQRGQGEGVDVDDPQDGVL
jgi:hypothetical protein